jgi:hypothetical protein
MAMRLLHHHDDDKEFRAWTGDLYDDGMVPMLLLHISLALPAAGLTADARHAAFLEIAAIWSAHGVVVAAASDRVPVDAAPISVVVEARPSSLGSAWGGPLASVRFDAAGTPVPVITLYLAALVDMIARANTPGAGGGSAPAILRERAIGRAVGRVLAHELGHVLLRSRWHAGAGLMRPVHTAADLVGPERAPFALSAPDAARLAIVTLGTSAAWSRADCLGAVR